MLDFAHRLGKRTRSSRNMVFQKDYEDIVDRGRKTNEEVLEMAGYMRSLHKAIREQQLDFFGHINEAEVLENISANNLRSQE